MCSPSALGSRISTLPRMCSRRPSGRSTRAVRNTPRCGGSFRYGKRFVRIALGGGGGQKHTPDEVVVSVGAKHSLFNLAVALYDPGHEVIVPAPYWVSYPEQVRLVGATPVIVETTAKENYRLTPEKLSSALNTKTRALVLCTPSNPTGSAYRASDLEALADVLRGHDCYVIVDEIYGQLVYGAFEQKSLLEIAPDLRERLIVVDGVAKAYAMTGWRIGWTLGPADVAKACDKVQGQSTTNPTAVAQYAAIAAVSGDQKPIAEMRKKFEERRAIVVEGLNAIDGISAPTPDGGLLRVRRRFGSRGAKGGRDGARGRRGGRDLPSRGGTLCRGPRNRFRCPRPLPALLRHRPGAASRGPETHRRGGFQASRLRSRRISGGRGSRGRGDLRRARRGRSIQARLGAWTACSPLLASPGFWLVTSRRLRSLSIFARWRSRRPRG